MAGNAGADKVRQDASARTSALSHGARARARRRERRANTWPDCDPAEGQAAEWEEHAACREADGMDRCEAEATAWRDMLC